MASQPGDELMFPLLLTAPWKKSKQGGAHEYIHRDWVNKSEFVAFVTTIRATGYVRVYQGRSYKYLNVGGYKYWTMGASIDETIILNREKIDERDREFI